MGHIPVCECLGWAMTMRGKVRVVCVAGGVQCEEVVLRTAACACESERRWLGMWSVTDEHVCMCTGLASTCGYGWTCQEVTHLLHVWGAISRGVGPCSAGSQPSLPDLANPPKQEPPGPSGPVLWLHPPPTGALYSLQGLWHLEGPWVGTKINEASSDFTDRACSLPPPWSGLPRPSPAWASLPLCPAWLPLDPWAVAWVPNAQVSGLGEGETLGLLW